jgi:hypothetical protein
MKSKQFTLGLIVLILIQLLSIKTLAQCCVAPVNLTDAIKWSICGGGHCYNAAFLRWQRIQKAGCTPPVKYRFQYRMNGGINWVSFIVTTKPNAKFGEKIIGPPTCACRINYEWRVQGICSDTNKTDFVDGPNFSLKGTGIFPFTTSSTSDASSQGKLTVAAYPNPVAGELKLSGNLKAGGPVNVQIINSVGQTILRQGYNFNPGNFNTGIDVSKLPPGVYLVVVNDKTERATLTVLKQ